ncbi:stage II sporulation protein M [Methanobrevibacter filiformis]|uniref:Stage II sporulation protein M n=1 Tax=Methanobrevibacter filiformis TaxID=55758 RepID=A0A166CUT7_9EURY|nr:stage II sporulation protein M [Methanobrevibacter filiformis]KZX16987.1 hypothetical protein MBFIL_04150 [Methanobrevibacter filiformis]
MRKDNKYYINFLLNEIRLAFVENKFILLFATLIFVIPMFLGYYFHDAFSSFLDPMINSFKDQVTSGEIKLETGGIFLNNVKVALSLYYLAIFLGIFAIALLAYNGLFIGYYASGSNLLSFSILVLPHGILELPGIIIAGAAGFTLLIFCILFIKDIILNFMNSTDNSINNIIELIKNSYNKNFRKLVQSFILLAVSVLMILIAAVIEANLTLSIAKTIFDFLH